MKPENYIMEAHNAKDTSESSFEFDEHKVLHDLKHYLPAQAPLKDFIHHNTLHAFQSLKFFDALRNASCVFGYKVSLSLNEYRSLYNSGHIREDILEKIIIEKKGEEALQDWSKKIINKNYDASVTPRIGELRVNWKKLFHVDLDFPVHPVLFRVLCSYLDQGVSIWNFPISNKGFLNSLIEIESQSYTSFFRSERARKLLLENKSGIKDLLKILVGNESFYYQYLFDQQFAHQGWSGMVATVESQPESLLDTKKISLHDLIVFELLLEIDALDSKFGDIWGPLCSKIDDVAVDIFEYVPSTELSEVMSMWQEAYEWSYYDGVLAGLKQENKENTGSSQKSFQAMFCIDDRECSIRRYLEKFDPNCETFGTPGFFGVEFYFKPEHGKFHTKLCPAPVTPKYLIKEVGTRGKREKDVHHSKKNNSLIMGWLLSQTLGFVSAFRLIMNVFRPSMSPATANSFKQMDKFANLTIENKNTSDTEDNLQIGFTIDEMTVRVEGLLKSIGLVKDFAPIVYVIGHGSSSVNNTYYAGYDCGACSGRPGSVNARVVCFMANHPEVRKSLAEKGLNIPAETQFIGGLHDTTRDEIDFFDEQILNQKNSDAHTKNKVIFYTSLDFNAKERSRRFESIDTKKSAKKIHSEILTRSVSLFEPRPEYNHATNALCIVGPRDLTKNLFLDRRSFLNSYDYKIDPDGELLFNIMKPLGPVCGGINLEYFFSRVDNHKLGAGTKLPHNVMGLFGVANGADGDLRPGLPCQMIEIHDPLRLMIIVEQKPAVVLQVIKKVPEVYEWYINEWIHLVALDPDTKEFYLFNNGNFTVYDPLRKNVDSMKDLMPIFEKEKENIDIYSIQ